jgi:diguanylate cyclase (GGDEF)-like protein
MGYGSYTQLVIYGELLLEGSPLVSQTERSKMGASVLAGCIKRRLAIRDWGWWQLPLPLRCYVAAVPVATTVTIGTASAYTDWSLADLGKFLLLMACALTSVAFTPRVMYTTGGVTKDFTTLWVLPTAVLLPPIYAAIVPIPIFAVLHLCVHRGVPHRTVFTAASVSLCYTVVSLVFRSVPSSFAGESVGSGMHALTWSAMVAACYLIGSRMQVLMIGGAVKLSDRRVRVLRLEWNRDGLQALFVEVDLSVLVTLAVGLSPALVIFALPTVLLVRRYLVHPLLVAQSRVDAKTGLLNVSTWEKEAEVELSRAVRTRSSLALAILDIDHFKRVNDTYGHLVGDRVIKAVADAIKGQSRDYDKVGRFGGEEFVLLLAQADEDDACRIAERLRTHIGELAVPVDDRPGAEVVHVTISIGVSAIERGITRDLTDLLTAADFALYQAKQAGRNRVAAAPVRPGEFAAEIVGRLDAVSLGTANGTARLATARLDTVAMNGAHAGNGNGNGNGSGTTQARLSDAHLGAAQVVPGTRSSVRSDQAGASLCPRR